MYILFSSLKEEPKGPLDTAKSKIKDASETVVNQTKDAVESAKDMSKKMVESVTTLVKKDKKEGKEEDWAEPSTCSHGWNVVAS